MVRVTSVLWALGFILCAILLIILLPISMVVGLVGALLGEGKFKQYGINVWHALDNLGSAMTGGDSEEAISSRLGKARDKGSKWGIVANGVDAVAADFFQDYNHCSKYREHDEGDTQVTKY